MKWSCSVVSDSLRPHGLQPTRLLHPWDFPGKSTGVGCHCLLRLCWIHSGSSINITSSTLEHIWQNTKWALRWIRIKVAEGGQEFCFHMNTSPDPRLPLSLIRSMSQPNRKPKWLLYVGHALTIFCFKDLYEQRHRHKHIHSFPPWTAHVCRWREWSPPSVGVTQRNQSGRFPGSQPQDDTVLTSLPPRS